MSSIKKLAPHLLINFYHYFLAFLGAFFYDFPSRKMLVIGVTGTKGKTTAVYLIGKIFEETGAKVGWISSSTVKIGGKEFFNPAHMTMPGRFFIQRILNEMVKADCSVAIIEVTSQGILQYRHRFIDFDELVFTNLAPEHIEAHGSFEDYRKAKGKLFEYLQKTYRKDGVKKISVVNIDDLNGDYFIKYQADEKYMYSVGSYESNPLYPNIDTWHLIRASDVKISPSGLEFSVNGVAFNLKLFGIFNAYNASAAISVAVSRGIDLNVCKRALEKITVIPGRAELINEGQNFTIVVDYAHTPDSFDNIFKTAINLSTNRIISVFGSAGGGRDKWKREELGKIAAKYSDLIILTDEDPYEENPSEILSQIEKGILIALKDKPASRIADMLYKILDRREAIKKGLNLAQEGDVVLILGKGSEQVIHIMNQQIPWDDRRVVREELLRVKSGDLSDSKQQS